MATQAAAARAWAEAPHAPAAAPPVRPVPPADDPYGYGLRRADPCPTSASAGSFDSPTHGSGDGFTAPT